MAKVDGYWVPGGSMVFIPKERLHEIHKVLEEHRKQELMRARLLATLRRV